MTRIVKLCPPARRVVAACAGALLLASAAAATPAATSVGAARTARDRAYADREIVTASRALNLARNAVAPKPTPRGLTLLAQATNAVETARASFREGDLVTARQFAARAQLLCQDIRAAGVDREDVRRRLERVLREITRLVGHAGDSPKDPLRLHLGEADRIARVSRDAYLNGQLDQALERLGRAEKLIADARSGDYLTSPTRLAAEEAARKVAEARLRDADAQIKRAAAKHTRGAEPGSRGTLEPPPLAAKTLAGAREFARTARDHFAKQSWDAAAANARLAMRLATRAENLAR